MVKLVTLEAVKRRQRIFHDDDDPDLETMIEQASDIILNYINKSDPAWNDQTAPPLIQAAVLLQVGFMWANRGDADPLFAPADGYLDRRITSILYRYRKPVLA